MVEKLNGDLLQPSGIRCVQYPLVLALFISIAYGNGLISGVILFVVVYPNPYEAFSVTKLTTPLGTFLFVGVWVHDVLELLFVSLCLCVMFRSVLSHWYHVEVI